MEIHVMDWVVIALYFMGILGSGIIFGRYTNSTKDFFFGGQRFAWWLVAISCVATLVGSYSFLIYSETAFTSGISSVVCYTNDWFVIPLFVLGWLPIIYFSRVNSIPEYFSRRFDERTRIAALVIILIYLVGYIGINLYTIGTAVKGMLGYGTYQVAVEEIKDSKKLVQKLQKPQDDFSKALVGHLSKEFNGELQKVDVEKVDAEFTAKLSMELNKVVNSKIQLYDKDSLAKVQLSEKSQKLAKDSPEKGAKLVKLNRLLLTDVYPDAVDKVDDGLFVIYVSAIIVALISAIYMHHGGQTSVIMTDLLQGMILLVAGFLVLGFGVYHIGGWANLWGNLPAGHKLPFPGFKEPTGYHALGLFWSDAITASIAFYCMNQGILMRFMSARSVRDGKKAIWVVVLVLMPITAIAVSNAGWIGKAMQEMGMLDEGVQARDIFVHVANTVLLIPGLFGLVMAALVAALMSTLDTYVNAVSAIAVNDIWRNKVKPGMDDAYYLHVARYFALAATLMGILLVPIFHSSETIFAGFNTFTATVTPPMIVVITLAILWRNYTATAAFLTLVIGFTINAASTIYPEIVAPFAHGVDSGGGYSYMRAFFGTVVCVVLAIVINPLTKAKESEETEGLVITSIQEARRAYKGGEPSEEGVGKRLAGTIEIGEGEEARFTQHDMDQLSLKEGDLVHISDSRGWLGGLRSSQYRAGKPHEGENGKVLLAEELLQRGNLLRENPVVTQKIM